MSPALAAILLLAAAPGPNPAADVFPRGEVVERVTCATDPNQSYALYLPASCLAGVPCPVAILMDPRGRALVPMGLFRAAAEKRGYILMSAYGTRSDSGWEPNAMAVGAMVPEALARHGADPRRVYLAGFSGTARAGWEFGLRLTQHVAGLIGFGGGLPFALDDLRRAPFPFFGGAGRLDFNFEEMLALDARLDAMKTPHRFEPYDGPHGWGPEAICAEAIDWMEIQAMKRALRPKSGPLVQEIFHRREQEARSREAAGDLYAAFLAWRALARDAAGLIDPAAHEAKAGALERTPIVRKTIDQRRRLAARQTAYEARLSSFIQRFDSGPPPPTARSLIDLQIASLKRRAAGTRDPLDADAARRLLELVFVHASFYEPRRFLDRGDPSRALAMLEVGSAIRPSDPGVLYAQARAWALAGDKVQALEALKRAVQAGVSDVERLENDEALEPLRAEPGYLEIITRLRAAGAARP